jgi:hypothetical protein
MPSHAQYETEKQATVPLEYFYIKRDKSAINFLLSKFTLGLSTGAGVSFFNHSLDGFTLQQTPGREPLIFVNNSLKYDNWFNRTSVDTASLAPGTSLFSSSKLGFKGRGLNIPLKATLHYEYLRYRVGIGYSYEFMTVGRFRPTDFEDQIGTFSPAARGGFMRRFFGMAGVSVLRYQQYLLVADVQIGSFKPSRAFNLGQIQKGLYYNLGVTIERDLSEYFKLFVRPSYDIKKFTIAFPEAGQAIRHGFNAFYLNVGATYRLPELRKCPIDGCKAQINHAHGNKEYRSKRHPIYKKQNPYYGENYPTLLKYKGANKRKLNPY